MVTALLTRQQRRQTRIDALQRLPLEPLEYCRRWLDHPEDERGWYKACTYEIARVTGAKQRTVEIWSPNFERCPETIKIALRKQDALNQIARLLKDVEEIEE